MNISSGNSKIGNIQSFDLPAVITCPGATELCKKKCYALNLQRIYPQVNKKYIDNLKFSESKEFVDFMITNIVSNSTFRIHVSGDFHSADYIRKWIRIVKARPDVKFFCYSRSWRVARLKKALAELMLYKNITINYSCDDESGKPPKNARYAFLSIDNKAPRYLRKQDIIFRSNHNAQPGNHQWLRNKAVKNGENPDKVAPLIHNIGRSPICPKERGKNIDLTCEKCKICIN